MSREILFRAKRENWRELPKEEWWVEGSLCHVFQEDKQAPICGIHRDVYYVIQTNAQMYVVAPETVCQYTGLTDMHGDKIFEGDIVEIPAESSNFVVEWDLDTASYGMHEDGLEVDFDNYWGEEVNVIGNRFDTPELLSRI